MSEFGRRTFVGFLSGSAAAMGADHVLFATDWPAESNKLGAEFMETAPMIGASDKEKIFHLNAEGLFKL
jgi:predicted TIM-barrel fold metal-dependent hydrolase